MRELWISDTEARVPTVNQLELALANMGYNRKDAKLYGLQVVGAVKTVVLLNGTGGPGTAHDRLHAMDSAADHAAVTAEYRGYIPQADPATGEWALVPMPEGGGGTDTTTRLISGTVTWLTGLTFHVTDTVYKIWGLSYGSSAVDIELTAADELLPRIDVIAVDVNGDVVVLTGIPATNPAKPIADPFTQLELTQILIPAGATEPADITITQVYDENIEWATSSDTPNVLYTDIDFESTVSPFKGAKCIAIEKLDIGGIAKTSLWFTGSPFTVTSDGALTMQLRSNQPWDGPCRIAIQMKLAGNPVGLAVMLTRSNYGNNSAVTGWNYIVIPASDFSTAGLEVDEIEMQFSNSTWGTVGMVIGIDDIQLQNGAGVTPPPDLSHARAHQINSVLDHPAVEPVNYNKLVATNAVTGEIEFVDKPTGGGGVTPVDDILHWDTDRYMPYYDKLEEHPGIPYFYQYYLGSSANPSNFSTYLALDAILLVSHLGAYSVKLEWDGDGFTHLRPGYIQLRNQYSEDFILAMSPALAVGSPRIAYLACVGQSGLIPIRIGSNPELEGGGDGNAEYILVDDPNQRFDINMTKVKFSKGTASKWLALDANKEVVYMDAPTGGGTAQIQSDWNQTNNLLLDYIKNKPTIPAAQIQSDWNQVNTSLLDYIKNKPAIPAAQIQSDWNQANTGLLDYIKNKPALYGSWDLEYWGPGDAWVETAIISGRNVKFVNADVTVDTDTVTVTIPNGGLTQMQVEGLL